MTSNSCNYDIYTTNYTIYNNTNDTTFAIESNTYTNTFTTDTSGNLTIDSSNNITITAANTLTVAANIDASGKDISCNVLNYTTLNPTPAGGGDVSTNATNTYTNLSINYFDNAQLCAGTLQLTNYNTASSIPPGQIGTNYNGIACVNNLPYFYPENANPYLYNSWNALALQSNYTYINPTLSQTTNIGNSFITDTLNMKTTNFYTSQAWRNTILNSPINSAYTGQFNTIVGYSPTNTNIITGSNNTIVGSSNGIQIDCSNCVILGNNNSIQSGAYNAGAIGNENILTNNNTIVIANNYTTTADNQIVLGNNTQIPYTQCGYFAFNPTYVFFDASSSNPIELYANIIGSDFYTNNIYGYDGLYWNRLTQKNAPFGYNNDLVSAMNITFTWNPYSLNLQPLSLFTLHMNFVYSIADMSNNYTTTTIIVSNAIVTIDLYAIMVQHNDASFNSTQSSNTVVTGSYCNGYADIGMIKFLQPPGDANWTSTYSGYPMLQANTVTYDASMNLGTLGLTFYPADISNNSFPASYHSACNGVIEIKCDKFMPSPYQSQFTFSRTAYPIP